MAKQMPNSLDYDDLLESFRTFLKSQDALKDYNFDGSAMSVLLRAMAYNATIQAYSDNALFNEGFLNTAERYSSVASNASFLGYTPRSVNSARASINFKAITSDASAPNILTIGPDNLFTCEKDNKTFSFRPISTYSATVNSGTYDFGDVELVEGDVVSNTFLQQGSAVQSFVIPNRNIDTSTLIVRVYPNYSSDVFETFEMYSGNLGKDLGIYFLEMNLDGYYQIEFGDGLISKSLSNGNVVYIEYRVGSAADGNGCNTFTPSFKLLSDVSYILTTKSVSSGGADRESIDSIKRNAKYNFAMPSGLVTESDYVAFVKSKYGNIVKDAIAWGGEKMTPPKHGYVYVAVQPINTLTTNDRQRMVNAMSEISVGSITPVLTDPVYATVMLDIQAYYSGLDSSLDANSLKQGIIKTVEASAASDVTKFGGSFTLSDFIVAVKDSNSSIGTINMAVKYKKVYMPTVFVDNSFELDFDKKIVQGSVYIDGFRLADVSTTSTYHIKDTSGTLKLYRTDSGSTVYLKDVGNVDYTNGIVRVRGINVTTSNEIVCVVSPEYTNADISPKFNEILKVEVSSCVVIKE